ncbi:MAG: AAA family ATPase, partial [Candidatus Aminicenantes bacterium]|nr:AAA family ATPase [Candidatus Aminicenantes bacterium]
DADRVLIPDLLAIEEREFVFDYENSLRFIIEYDFLPRSVLPRFMVRLHRDIKEGIQWRTGVVLQEQAFHAEAVVKADEEKRRIYIYVSGQQKRDYFSIIRKTIRDINASFEKLKTTELVPLPDHPEITVNYEDLIGHEAAGQPEKFVGELKRAYSVAQLLDGIEKKEKIQAQPRRDKAAIATIEIPYGIGSYEKIREDDYYYVDKTGYLEVIEKAGKYLFFIRPRRFGKSLFLSMMETYYDVNKKEKFDFYFKGTDVFNNPTPERNSYLVLKFDFSGIASTKEQVEESFLCHVRDSARTFISKYKKLLNINEEKIIEEIEKTRKNPADVLEFLLTLCKVADRKIYIIIDEYDNFANTILSTSGEKEYEDLTHGGGFFKTFFAMIKKGTSGSDIPIGRIFITGVSPITLDDVTSGFNIGENISIDKPFNEMMGFTNQEVIDLIEYYRKAGRIKHETGFLFEIMNEWYNHYRFYKESGLEVFNPTLVMYFLKEYRKEYKLPEELIDRNVRIDYGKLRHLVLIDRMGDKKTNGNFSKLQAVMENEFVTSKLVKSFPLNELMRPENFYTLLFYFGLLTIKGVDEKEQTMLSIPNETIRRLYYEYISAVYEEMNIFTLDLDRYNRLMNDMAYKGKWKPIFDYISERMNESMGLRDLITGEKAVQVFLNVYLGLSDLYLTHSEKELNKGYADIVMEPFMAKYKGIRYSYLIEIKYMKAEENREKLKKEIEPLKLKAEEQLRNYSMDEKFAKSIMKTDLIKLVSIFSGHRLVYIGESKS